MYNSQALTYPRKTPGLFAGLSRSFHPEDPQGSAGPFPDHPSPAGLSASGGPPFGEPWTPALHLKYRRRGLSMMVPGYPEMIEMLVCQ